MSIASMLTHSATVQRPVATTGIKKTFQAHGDPISCLIQSLDAVAAETAHLAFGKAYQCFMPLGSDVKDGDQLIDNLGRTLSVRGIRTHNYGRSFPHLQLTLSEDSRS